MNQYKTSWFSSRRSLNGLIPQILIRNFQNFSMSQTLIFRQSIEVPSRFCFRLSDFQYFARKRIALYGCRNVDLSRERAGNLHKFENTPNLFACLEHKRSPRNSRQRNFTVHDLHPHRQAPQFSIMSQLKIQSLLNLCKMHW